MEPLKPIRPTFARDKANLVCSTIRNAGGKYNKRYTTINQSGTLLKVKLWGIQWGFREAYESTCLPAYFKEKEIKTNWIPANSNINSYSTSFVFWIPIK